jgi:hypothetical protein
LNDLKTMTAKDRGAAASKAVPEPLVQAPAVVPEMPAIIVPAEMPQVQVAVAEIPIAQPYLASTTLSSLCRR